MAKIIDNNALLLLLLLSLTGLKLNAQGIENPYQVKNVIASSLMPDRTSYIAINWEQDSYKITKRALEDGSVIDEYPLQYPVSTINMDSYIAVSPNGNYLAICGNEPDSVGESSGKTTKIVVYDLQKKRTVEVIELKRKIETGPIKSIAFNSSSSIIFFSIERNVLGGNSKNYIYKLYSGNIKNIPTLDNYVRIASTNDNRIILASIDEKFRGFIKRLGGSNKGSLESIRIFSLENEEVRKLNSMKEVNVDYFSNDFDPIEARELYPSIDFATLKSPDPSGRYAFTNKYILHKPWGGVIIYDLGGKIKILNDGSPEVIAKKDAIPMTIADKEKEISVRYKFAEKYPEQYPLKGIHLNSAFMVTSKQGAITEFRGNESFEKQFSLNTVAKVGDKRIELVPVEFPNSKSYLSKRYCNAIEKMFTGEPEYTHYFLGKSSYDGRYYFVFNNMTYGFKSKSNSIISIRDMLEIDRDESEDFSIDAVRRLANNNILIIARINRPYQTYPLFLNDSDKASGKLISDNKAWVSSLMKFIILAPNGESVISKKSYLFYPISYMVDETGFYIVTNSIVKPVEFKIENSSSLLAIGKQINTIEGGGIAVRNKNGGVAVTKFSNDLKILWHKVVEEWSDYNVETDIFGSSFIMGDKVYVHTINYKNYIANKPYQMLAIIDKKIPTTIEKSFGKESNLIMLLNSIDNRPIRINYDFRHESRDNFIPNLVGADLFKERIQYVDLSELFSNK